MKTPSPHLADLIQRWIEEIDHPETPPYWHHYAFKAKNALCIAGNQVSLWGLTPTGEVLWVDTDRYGFITEPETDPRYLYAALRSAADKHPELQELVPERPPGVERCPRCESGPASGGSDVCACSGLGWLIP